MLTHRPATTTDHLRTATDLMAAAWRAGSRFVAATPAAIEWWYALTFPDPLGEHLRLWYEGSRPVAWSWHEAPEVEWHVWTGDARRDVAVFRAIVDTAAAEARGGDVAMFAAEDDTDSIAVLTARGFEPAGRRLSQWQRWAGAEPVESVSPPRGYRIRPLAGPAEFPARVDLHRAAFPASTLTVDKYSRLLTVPHYRIEHDLVAEAPDGSLAAFALGWFDAEGAVAEFEPVGTRPEHRRRGLAAAVLTAGLARFVEAGASTVQVYGDATESAAEALYSAVGFRRRAFHQRYALGSATATDATIGA